MALAKEAFLFLQQKNLTISHRHLIADWLRLAQKFDPQNMEGFVELFFEFDWYFRANAAPPAELPKLIEEMEQWKKDFGFKDNERAAFLCADLAKRKAFLGDLAGAVECMEEGLLLNPADQRTRMELQSGPLFLGMSPGTGFAVSDQGHFLTSFQAAGGPGHLYLRLAGQKGLVKAQLVAENPGRDLALIKTELPPEIKIPPLRLVKDYESRRGDAMAVLGYPINSLSAKSLKFIKGGISALPEPANGETLALDVKVTPGARGGLAADNKGNVIGMLKGMLIPLGAPVETFGQAIPPKDINAFLQKNLPGYEPAEAKNAPLEWNEVDQRLNPSVVLVLKWMPRLPPGNP